MRAIQRIEIHLVALENVRELERSSCGGEMVRWQAATMRASQGAARDHSGCPHETFSDSREKQMSFCGLPVGRPVADLSVAWWLDISVSASVCY